MFYSDRPIDNKKEDLLGRKSFSFNLTKSILAYTQSESLTIGLIGKWGSGKTSIINIVENEIYTLTDKNIIPIVIKFNPWNYSNQEQLIDQFFRTLSNGLKISNIKDNLNNISAKLEKLGQVIDFTKHIPVLNGISSIISPLVNDYASVLKGLDGDEDLSIVKSKIVRALNQYSGKVIVIIDDIDRLNKVEVTQILQLVKSLADFPNTIYLLSFDKEVVIEALDSMQMGSGSEYLEKIIQIPLYVPKIEESKVIEVFIHKANEIIKGYPLKKFDNNYWSKIFGACIRPFLKNIRDVNRVLNVFTFKYNLMKDEVNISDLMAITAFQVLIPKLYEWIRNNKSFIIGDEKFYLKFAFDKDNDKKIKGILEKELNKFDNKEIIKNALCSMFPKINNISNDMISTIDSNELIRTQRISAKKKFDLYFNLDIDNIELSSNKIDEILLNYNSIQMVEFLKIMDNENKVINLLIEIQSKIGNMPLKRSPIILQAMFNVGDTLESTNNRGIMSLSATQYCKKIINMILERFEDVNVRYNVLKNAINETSESGLYSCTYILNRIELAYGRLASNTVDCKNQIISLEQLLELEKIVVNKIESVSETYNLLEYRWYRLIFYIWNCFEQEKSKEYLKKLLKDSLNICKFIGHCATEWTGGEEDNWEFKMEDIEGYIKFEDAVKSITTTIEDKKFDDLDKWIRDRCIAFLLWVDKGANDGEEIYMSEVNTKLLELFHHDYHRKLGKASVISLVNNNS